MSTTQSTQSTQSTTDSPQDTESDADTTEAPESDAGDSDAATTPEGSPQSESEDEALGEGGKKALVAERKARKEAEAANAELRRQLQAQAQEGMSDLEKAQQAAKDAEETAAKATTLLEKLRIVARHGLDEQDAEDLPDDLEKAERLATRLAAGRTKPKADPTQGGMGSHAAKTNGEKFADFANNFFTR